MKAFLLFAAALFMLFASCGESGNPNVALNINPDAIKAKNNKEMYNRLLLGEWAEIDSGYSVKPGGIAIEFKNNEMLLPAGKWHSDTYSEQIMPMPIRNFATLFDYTSPATNKKFTALKEDKDSSGIDYLYGGINLDMGSGNYILYYVGYYFYDPVELVLSQDKIKYGSREAAGSLPHSFIRKSGGGGNGSENENPEAETLKVVGLNSK